MDKTRLIEFGVCRSLADVGPDHAIRKLGRQVDGKRAYPANHDAHAPLTEIG
jgi:hypothetical protein